MATHRRTKYDQLYCSTDADSESDDEPLRHSTVARGECGGST